MDDDPLQWLKRLAESQKSVRLGTGVIGKTTQAVLAVIALWIGVVLRMSESLVQNVFSDICRCDCDLYTYLVGTENSSIC